MVLREILAGYGEREESLTTAVVFVLMSVYFLYVGTRPASQHSSRRARMMASATASLAGLGVIMGAATTAIFRALHEARGSGNYAALPPSHTPFLVGVMVVIATICAACAWFGRDTVTRRLRWTLRILTSSLLIATISMFGAVMGADAYWGPWVNVFYNARDISVVVAVLIVPAAVVDGVRYGRTLRQARS